MKTDVNKSKAALRQRLAALPIEEKFRILEAMRTRHQTIVAARVTRERVAI